MSGGGTSLLCGDSCCDSNASLGHRAGVDGLLGCLVVIWLRVWGLTRMAPGCWWDWAALASSHFRPLGLGLGNRCCIFRAKPPIPLSGLSGLQRSLGRQHSGCQNKPAPVTCRKVAGGGAGPR